MLAAFVWSLYKVLQKMKGGDLHPDIGSRLKNASLYNEHVTILTAGEKKKNGNVPSWRTSKLNVIICYCVPLWSSVIYGTLISLHLHQLNDFGGQGDSLKNNTLLTKYHPCVRSAQEPEPNKNHCCQVKPLFVFLLVVLALEMSLVVITCT